MGLFKYSRFNRRYLKQFKITFISFDTLKNSINHTHERNYIKMIYDRPKKIKKTINKKNCKSQ